MFDQFTFDGLKMRTKDPCITHTCPSCSKIVLHTPHTIEAVVRRLETAHPIMGKTAFEELEKALG